MLAIIAGFFLGGILPSWGLNHYLRYRRWQAIWKGY